MRLAILCMIVLVLLMTVTVGVLVVVITSLHSSRDQAVNIEQCWVNLDQIIQCCAQISNDRARRVLRVGVYEEGLDCGDSTGLSGRLWGQYRPLRAWVGSPVNTEPIQPSNPPH
jgi:hypothetical protein